MLKGAPLGQKTEYTNQYTPSLLFPVPRSLARDKIALSSSSLPFTGIDIWNSLELSWLNPKGKPVVAGGEFIFPCDTENLVESKSLKLYLNSFNQTAFSSLEEVQEIIKKDLWDFCGLPGEIKIYSIEECEKLPTGRLEGICLDDLDITTNIYEVEPAFLKTSKETVEETLYSHFLKSNCLATGQPDWGTLLIKYKGPKIDHEGLLKYIISYRNHSGFAEHCVEQIFVDLMKYCQPEKLTVYARYTKRGGLDINPFRSNFEQPYKNVKLVRQ